ncbi:MAG: FkbM family methyltransferase [Pseudomonadota bacterium]
MFEQVNKRRHPTRTFPEFFQHIKKCGFSPSVCIDVGAASGTMSIYQSFPDACHIVFEPLADFHRDLEANMRSYKHEIHHCALMAKPGKRRLLRHPDKFGSSLMHRRQGRSSDLVEIEVQRLDDVLEGRDLSNGVLLKTDCQGADLFVIEGAPKTLRSVDVVIMECSLFKFWGEHHPELYEIVTYMHARGFVVYDLLEGIFRPFDGALGQIDVVFVKADGPFRKAHQW